MTATQADRPGGPSAYRGRFAPSPTGPLHFGSLVAATASCLEARCHGGQWLVRMEDVDRPRERPGAAADILATLEAFGLHWDGPILYQSGRTDAYAAAMETLHRSGLAYPCACSRSEIAASLPQTGAGQPLIYPGTCRQGIKAGRKPRAWRVHTEGATVELSDRIQGSHHSLLERDTGDFVIRRADRLFAYQLAVVVDDADQDITDVVRGCDLLDSTPRQIHLQRLLGLPTPIYAHLPVVLDARGRKLSKQTRALPVDRGRPGPAVWQVLDFLGQRPPADLARANVATLWQWALEHWQLDLVPRQSGRPLPNSLAGGSASD